MIEQRVQELYQLLQYIQGDDLSQGQGYDAAPDEASETTSGQSATKIPVGINRTPYVFILKKYEKNIK